MRCPTTSNGLNVSGPSLGSVHDDGSPPSIARSVFGVRSRTATPVARSKSISAFRGSENIFRAAHRCEFLIEAGERGAMHQIAAVEVSVRPDSIECSGGIIHDGDIEAEVRSRSHRAGD